MYKNRRILAVIPARGGSKGIPNKNIHPVKGIPLVSRIAQLLPALTYIDCAVLSTDSDSIAAMAAIDGLKAPFRRPSELSGDRIADYDVLAHALTRAEHANQVQYDIVLMLQPTSPMRKAQHITGALELLEQRNFDAVWSVSRVDSKHHPLKQLTIKDGRMEYYDPQSRNIIARQQLSPLYQRNGVVYAISRKCLMNYGNIKGALTGAYVIDEPCISIDTLDDVDYVEFLMNEYGDPLDC